MNELEGRPMWYDRMLRPLTDLRELRETRENKRVGGDHIGELFVSTVFLALDHAFSGPPLLFETMIFGKEYPVAVCVDGLDEQYRYHTEPEAFIAHAMIVGKLRVGRELPPARKELTT